MDYPEKKVHSQIVLERDEWVYQFGRGISAEIWGPSPWVFKHSLSFQHRGTMEDEAQYYLLTRENLPCSSCTESFSSFQNSNPYFVHSRKSKQLAWLLHQTHNHVNAKNKKPLLSFDLTEQKFGSLSPSVWLLAMFDYLVACAVYQLDSSTAISFAKKKLSLSDKSSFSYRNLLPLHKLVLFLLQSSLLKSIPHPLVQRFIQLATHEGKSNLMNQELYNVYQLKRRKSEKEPFLGSKFVRRLDRIKAILFPDHRDFSLSTRAHLFLQAKYA